MITHRLISGAVAALLLACSHSGVAQTYPSKPIRILISFGPGSTNDTVARLLAPGLSAGLGQPVIVENMTTAGGTGAPLQVLRAPADGYNIALFTGSSASGQAARPDYPFDMVKDFDPVSMLASFPVVLATTAGSPIKTLQDLMARARSGSSAVTYASASIGSVTHLLGELIVLESGAALTSIPYKTPSAGLVDVLTGRVDFLVDNAPAAIAYFKAGKLRPIAITAAQRSPAFPNVPTLTEAIPGLVVDSWVALAVKASTPKPILERLNREVRVAAESAEMRQRLLEFGGTVYLSSPEEARKVMAADLEKWRRVIKERNIRID